MSATTHVVLRPLATSLPLGFLALTVATTAFAALQLTWIPATDGRTIALGVLVLTVPLQLVACLMGFLSRDPVAATGMGLLSGTWGGVCLATLTSAPGALSDGLGVLVICAGIALLVPAAAATAKLVPAAVITLSAVRFILTGIAEIDGGRGWMQTAAWVGLVLAIVSLYAALALELEGSRSRTVLPLGRSGAALDVSEEPGVRSQL
ncbi:hypothetical protein [Nocardioides sp. Kera G14]|uniref:hypothetical protein n=1 Tax=Nocardioides sp. Kera G14 TaxID=2884264 RepID=UPI001D11CE80|nr:hypothetical protein [Nocardioides sp. Kera G14]UDY24985.1 hypothetical protein LH076_06740 [Nocardioides sp. Kera G14]